MNCKNNRNPGQTICLGKYRRYIIPFLLLSLAAFSLLTGCQLQEILSQNLALEPTATPGVASGSQNLPAVTITPTAASPITGLILWLPPQLDPENGTTAGNLLKQRLSDFQKEHPQFTVEVRLKAEGGQGGLLDALTTTSAAAPAALPALVALPYPLMDSAVAGKLLEPISEKSVNLDDPDWLPFARGAAAINGITYGIPFGADALVLSYRPMQSPFPPTSWQQLVNQEDVLSFPAADPDAVVVNQIYLASGGSRTDGNGSPSLQSQPLQRTFEILNDGARNNVFPYWITNFSTFDQSWNAFLSQQSEYAVIWSSQYMQNRPENVSITSIPGIGNTPTTLSEGWVWCIPSDSLVNKQNSLLLAQYLSEPDFVNRWSQAAGYLPVRESGLESWRGQPDSQLVMELVAQGNLVLLGANDGVTAPLLEDAAIQIIKKQAFYQQLLDAILSKFQVK
jgi:ABC-type glycerol-3-phosphate transport system substrate-binding protein